MIYTVTFNPALDYYIDIENIEIGATNRSKAENIIFGGKGINVSFVLKQLGIESVALGFVAGFTGEALENGLKSSGIKTDFIKLDCGLTRINVKLKGESITEINAQGPNISNKDIDALFSKLKLVDDGDILILSGSIPSSLPQNLYEQLLSCLRERRVHTVIDACGNLLLNTLKYNPFLIKPNLSELEEICGHSLETDDEIIAAAKALQSDGAMNVLVSLGGDGALLLDETGTVHRVVAHNIIPVNTVGAGDSMVAGFVAGLDKGYKHALKLANAAGGATAASHQLATKAQIEKLL